MSRHVTRGRLAILWTGSFAGFFSFFLVLASFPLYAQHLGLASGAIGVVTAAFAISSMALRGWAGWAADRYGRRPIILAGSAIFMTAPAAYAAAAGVTSLFVVRLAHGAGMGLLPTAATAMVADVAPPGRRAEVLGTFGMASGLALALGPGAGILVARWVGFNGLFALAMAIAAIGFACMTLVPETLTTRETRRFHVADTVSRRALFPSALMLLMTLTYGALVGFLPLHADARGLNAGVFFVVYALALTAVRQPAGRLSDRRGRTPVVIAGLVILAAALVVLAFADTMAGLLIGGIVYGAGHGAAHTTLVAWAADGVPPEQRGRAMGTLYTALELAIAIGSIAAGLAVAGVGFTATFVAAGGVALVAAALAATRVAGP
ncbi:MAG: MFS transporter [Candidatus Rokubacteria bacterium]|nr:MFS transporter [Candidatus Rokubacteria bacterium]